MEETLCAYWLSMLDDINFSTVKKLFRHTASFSGIWDMTPAEYADPALAISKETVGMLISSRHEGSLRRSYERMISSGTRLILADDPDFPEKLRSIPDPPLWLYVRGRLPDPNILSVGMVGARKCSDYGRYVTNRIAESLGGIGIQVISGMALGVDGIAQKAAVRAGGYSAGVLGCGTDICYPRENRDIYDLLLTSGCIISEYHPGADALPWRFPMRNRIIAGLSDVITVTEARERSGSLITADFALDQGRDVYALPGRVTDSLSHGTNRLIKQGAGVILSPEEFIRDLCAEYGIGDKRKDPPCSQISLAAITGLSDDEKKVLTLIGTDPIGPDTLRNKTGLPEGSLYTILMKMSLSGLIAQKGSRYIRLC